MIQKKQTAVAFDGNTSGKTYQRTIAFCNRLAVKLAICFRVLA